MRFEPIEPPVKLNIPYFRRRSDLRVSQPAMLATGRAMLRKRDAMVEQWAEWLGERIGSRNAIPRELVTRELTLLINVMAQTVGPFRREAMPLWNRTCEHYGRVAAARGLAAGEVVDELQFLRELLIRNLSNVLVGLRARQGMATLLRLNRVLDRGIGVAVVGYTDALVATLLGQNGVPSADSGLDAEEVARQLDAIESELKPMTAVL